ncbi:MAG: exodeoxyribonuclease VII small subunit [Lachnospiraceae bacterium]
MMDGKECDGMAGRKKAEEEKQPSLEESMRALEEVMARMEEEELPLEQSFALYKQGMDLLMQCNMAVDKVEKELRILEEGGADEQL